MPSPPLPTPLEDLFQTFLNRYYADEVINLSSEYPDKKSLICSFMDLDTFNSELANRLLEEPDEVLDAATNALRDRDLSTGVILGGAHFRVVKLPKIKRIREIRSDDVGTLITIEGVVPKVAPVGPLVIEAVFECPYCGHIFSVEQSGNQFKEPPECEKESGGCGRKVQHFKMHERKSKYVNAQKIRVQDAPEDLRGGELPQVIDINFHEDLVGKVVPGDRVIVVGILRQYQKRTQFGKTNAFQIFMDANSLELKEEIAEEMVITDEDAKRIEELRQQPDVYEKLIMSVAPSVFGYANIKEALVLQLFGANSFYLPDGTYKRGDIHALIIGDPGIAKSVLLAATAKLALRGLLTDGTGATGRGLCVAPNSLVLANNGTISEIEGVVEEGFRCNKKKEFCKGVWETTDIKKTSLLTLSETNLKIKSNQISQLWKLTAPLNLISIKTQSGKEICTTLNTRLYTIDESGKRSWVEAKDFKKGDYLATLREFKIKENNQKIPPTIELIDSNPIVYGAKDCIKIILSKLTKDKTKRQLARELGLNENNLYHHWVNKQARGNIHLDDLKHLSKKSNTPLVKIATHIESLSLRSGSFIKIPPFLTEDLLYFAGLVAGDGDISEGNRHSYSIRFSNTSTELLNRFTVLANALFGVTCYYSDPLRTPAMRFGSRLVFNILNALGVPKSPKSNRIDLSNTLLNLPNNLVAAFISGLFDTDGSATEGEGYIDLTTTSANLAKKMQITLLRFGVHSTVRQRPPSPTEKIRSKHIKYVIAIRGKDNLLEFEREIGFRLTEKRIKLHKAILKISKSNTNVDIIPGAVNLLIGIRDKYKPSKKVMGLSNYKSNYSRGRLSETVKKLKTHLPKEGIEEIKCLSRSDIFWETVKEVTIQSGAFKFVYDLTIPNSHSFVVNGIIVHNTASAVKDREFSGNEWTAAAGAMVLADKGLLAVDEFDKMNDDDRDKMHQALEQQKVHLTKAGLNVVLNSRCALLAAANPKYGRFDKYAPIAEQINLSPALISRFDLIFPIFDNPNEETDRRVATHIMSSYKLMDGNNDSVEAIFTPVVDRELMRKYIAVAKKIKPRVSEEADEKFIGFYLGLRKQAYSEEAPVPVTARELDALVRLGQARARSRLSDIVTGEDANCVINLVMECLKQVFVDPETEKLDVDWVIAGTSKTMRDRARIIKAIITEFETEHGDEVPIEAVLDTAEEEGIDRDKAEEIIEVMKRDGLLFSRGSGVIGLVR